MQFPAETPIEPLAAVVVMTGFGIVVVTVVAVALQLAAVAVAAVVETGSTVAEPVCST